MALDEPMTGPPPSRGCCSGFSLVEVLASVVIITLLMSAVFAFMFQAQQRFQGNVVTSESNQSARAALELMTQEIGQAGYNPTYSAGFTNFKTVAAISASAGPQCVTLSPDSKGVNPGDWLWVDTGPNNEKVQVVATKNGYISPNPPDVPCGTDNQVRAVFSFNHTGSSTPVILYKFPYPTGMMAPSCTPPPCGTPPPAPYDQTLRFYGDINNDGKIQYVVYSVNVMTTPAVSITAAACPGTYSFYNLYRSITPVAFTPGTVNSPASALVQNVLYDSTNQRGPTCQPIFNYPSEVTVGVVPSAVTVVGTSVVTLSVAVNPKRLESGIVEWYTMATQIRPLNLASAVAANQQGGYKLLPPFPLDLPMTNPTPYYM